MLIIIKVKFNIIAFNSYSRLAIYSWMGWMVCIAYFELMFLEEDGTRRIQINKNNI